MKQLRLIPLLGVIAFLGSCATIPPGQFTEYTATFERAHEAGLMIYDQVVPALREGGSSSDDQIEYAVSLGPSSYGHTECARRYPDLPTVQARCDMLRAVTDYHNVLAALNAGASASTVKSRLGEVSQSLSSLGALAAIPAAATVIAPVSALIGPLSSLVGEALTLTDRLALKRHLEDGAPTLLEAISALEDDVTRIHGVQRAAHSQDLQLLENEIRDIMNPAFNVAATRDRTSDPEGRIVRRALDERFDALFPGPEPSLGATLTSLPNGPQDTPMSSQDLVQIGEALDAATPKVARFNAIVVNWGRFQTGLHAYDDMLAGLRDALSAMLSASNSPFALGGALAQLDGAVMAVRRDSREIGRILSGL